jgi:preprotein translocase subunit SecY
VGLSTGAMILTFLSSEIDKLKIGNGTSLLVFVSILSAVPATFASNFRDILAEDSKIIPILLFLILVTILGVVYVQEAERKIPINYASQYSGSITRTNTQTSYLPFKVNATGVMPIIFASSLLALPSNISRFSDIEFLQNFASNLNPSSPTYIFYNVGMIYLFNYFYTFIQFKPNDLSENLKKSGASVPTVRPGKTMAIYFERTLTRLSLLGSAFLSVLAISPIVTATFGLTSFSGFGATSIIILVGVSTDFTRRLRAEKILEEYREFDEDNYT